MVAAATSPVKLTQHMEQIRDEFPLLKREFDDKPIVYLDNAATAQKPEAVIKAIDRYLRYQNSNVHRGVYTLAAEADALFESARKKVAGWINAATPKQVIFVRNATEAINLVAYTWGVANVKAGDTILITELEHHSNIVPWQQLAKAKDAKLEYVPIDSEGRLDMQKLDSLIDAGPKMVAVTHISNVLGTINPVSEIVSKAKAVGAKVLIDGAQAAPQLALDMTEIDADFYVFTGHKMYGPTGVGVLYGRRELLEEMPPFLTGGDMISHVGRQESRWNELPWKFEAGTSAIAEVIGLGATVDWIQGIGMDAIRAHEIELTGYALESLPAVPGLKIFGPMPSEDRGAVVSFELEGIHPHDVAQILDRDAVCIRAGHHCAQPLMERLAVPATSRASFAIYNTTAEIDQLVESLQNARHVFKLD